MHHRPAVLLRAALLAATTLGLTSTGARAAPAISPAAGTPDASPQTQISILGVPPRWITSVRVVGAASGVHPGTLRPYSGARGASFLPRAPFSPGERVALAVRIRGRPAIRSSFTIARLAPAQPLLNLTSTQPSKLQHFVSRPALSPPVITVDRPLPGAAGSIFLTPLPSPVVHPGSVNTVSLTNVGPGGPMIVDGDGRLVWFKQLAPPDVAGNLQIQRYHGRRVLTWWQGGVTPTAFGIGEAVIADSSYRTLRTVRAGNGYPMDIHEFTLTPGGDALLTIYSPILVHLRGTPAGTLSPLMDAIVQQVDIRTGLVVWEWHGFGHIPLADSYATPANSASYDAYHFNALQQLPGDQVLVSARDTSAVYAVDRATGRIRWTLGGKRSSFRLGPSARFWFQHDARMLPDGRISLFDDGAGPPQHTPYSRGLILALDHRRHHAVVVHSYHRATDTSAQSEGSVQQLAGGHVFVGFGAQPFFSEFSAGGRLLFDARLPQDDGSYRAYRYRWSATPRTRPDIAARRADTSTVAVFASWNGATAVAHWQLLGGASAGTLAPVMTVRRDGFETRIAVPAAAAVYAVRALDARGHALASSRTVPAP